MSVPLVVPTIARTPDPVIPTWPDTIRSPWAYPLPPSVIVILSTRLLTTLTVALAPEPEPVKDVNETFVYSVPLPEPVTPAPVFLWLNVTAVPVVAIGPPTENTFPEFVPWVIVVPASNTLVVFAIPIVCLLE